MSARLEMVANRVRATARRIRDRGHPGFVYFVEAVDTGRIKIGWSKESPERRLRELSAACPFELRLLGAMVGCKVEEAHKHRLFECSRVPGKREWFFDSPEIREFISRWTGL